jgi:dolichol-phosphate mannosyltransferase
MNERILIIIPTYNERENLPKLAEAIYAQGPFHLLIVDDNSPDGTGDLAEELAARYAGRLFVLHRTGKLGLGTAYREGFRWGLARGYDLLFEMDADFSHDPRHLPQFLAAIAGGADLVLGSRYVRGGGTRNWSALRKLISRGGSLYARLILGLPFHDLTGGFKCFRRRVLESIDLATIGSNGYGFQIEMTYRAFQQGFRIVETPIVFPDRQVGESKMHGGIVREALLMVWRLRFAQPARAPRATLARVLATEPQVARVPTTLHGGYHGAEPRKLYSLASEDRTYLPEAPADEQCA